jgi:hypothetical protein
MEGIPMSRATDFFRKKYNDWKDFLWQNRNNENAVLELCELTKWSLRHYKDGNACPSPECVKLVEMVKRGRLPWPEWEGFTVAPEGIYPPNEYRQFTSPEDVSSRWLSVQVVSDLKREIRQLKSKLEETKSPLLYDDETLKTALWMVLNRGLDAMDFSEDMLKQIRVAHATHSKLTLHF